MALDRRHLQRPPVGDRDRPLDHRLLPGRGRDRDLLDPEVLAPVPRGGDAEPQRPLGRGAQHEVGRRPDPQQPPQHPLDVGPRQRRPPPGRRSLGHRGREGDRRGAQLGGPAPPAQPGLQLRPVVGLQVDHPRRQAQPGGDLLGPPPPLVTRRPRVDPWRSSAAGRGAGGTAAARVDAPVAGRRKQGRAQRAVERRRCGPWRRLARVPGRARGEVDERGLVEGLVRLGRHLGEPVGRRAAVAVAAGQQPVEHRGRRGVGDDLRQVLAADQEHVVDAQVGRHRLVARLLLGTPPLDDQRPPPPQPVGGGEEGDAVVPGAEELGPERPAPVQLLQQAPLLGRQAHHLRRPGGQRLGQARVAQRAQPGHELGDRGALVRHRRRPPGDARPALPAVALGTGTLGDLGAPGAVGA